jgi:putative endonuclease
MNNTELGSLGEQMACEYIRKKDFQIIERNYRFKKNEIDIIAQKDNQLIVIEVKTRHTAEIGEPWQAVTRNKQKQIIQVANQYIQTNNIELETRFDIISIVHNTYRTELTHLEGCLYIYFIQDRLHFVWR